MARHRSIDELGNGAEVFTDDLHLMALGFEIQDRVELGGAVVHVDAVAGAKALRHAEGAVQTHHMIDAQHTGQAHVVAQRFDVITIALLAKRFRMKRRKAPVLAFDEQSIGRRAAAHIEGK